MAVQKIHPTPKQREAYKFLLDTITKLVTYGGAAGGGKTHLGCEWTSCMCISYPGTGWFIGRESLNDLRIYNLQSMYEVFAVNKLSPEDYFKFNAQDNIFKFHNGSWIKYLELRAMPSDPLFERFGSTQFTGGWIEEAGSVPVMAFETLKARIGRLKNDEYGLLAKILITCNPSKNWLYRIYKDWKEGILPSDQQFIQALVYDNIYGQKNYVETLQAIKDKIQRERLLDGNWEYSNDPSCLIDQDAIYDLYNNEHVPGGKRFITADIARFGDDKTVIMLWNGFIVERIYQFSKISTGESTQEIRDLMREFQIPPKNVCVDDDGVGGGVVDNLHCRGFVNNSVPIPVKDHKENYANLKSQCYFKLAERINAGAIYIDTKQERTKEVITEELEQIKRRNMDKDGKLAVIPKEEMKEQLGRSPDFADTLMMRELFELLPKGASLKSKIV